MKQPIRSTYEYSKYQKKPYIETENYSPNISQKALSYEEYFNDNYQNSIRLSDVDAQIYKSKLLEENNNLYSQTQNLNQHINDLNNEINTLNQSLHQAKYSNNDLINKLNILQNDNEKMQNTINTLQNENDELKSQLQLISQQNDELNNFIGAKKNNFKGEFASDNIYIAEIQKLNELLEKYKELNDKNLSEKNSVEIIPLYFDMTDSAAMKNAVMQIRKTKKKIDILVNNAGFCPTEVRGFQMTTIDKIREVFDINFFATLQLTQYILKFMQGGSIINISSLTALEGAAGQLAYSASKAAIIGFTKSLAQELGQKNIRVNAVAPGFIDTDLMRQTTPPEYVEEIKSRAALKRLGTAEEIAKFILFLASDMSGFTTGEIIRVDGGQRV